MFHAQSASRVTVGRCLPREGSNLMFYAQSASRVTSGRCLHQERDKSTGPGSQGGKVNCAYVWQLKARALWSSHTSHTIAVIPFRSKP